MHIGTYNVRTLIGEDRVLELEEELKGIKWDIIGLAETRRRGESIQRMASGNVLYTIGTADKCLSGVGFLVNKHLADNIVEFRGVSDRVAMIVIKINSTCDVKIVQVYAPTTAHDDEEVEAIYDDIADVVDNRTTRYTIVMGDFNAKIGTRVDGEQNVMGLYGNGLRNERGSRLIEFATSRKLYIANTKFNKKISRKWTWRSPDGSIRNEIDFIMTSDPSSIKDVSVISKVNTGSDHRLVRCRLSVNTRLERAKMVQSGRRKINIETLTSLGHEFKIALENRFQTLHCEINDIDAYNNETLSVLSETALSVVGKRKPASSSKISEETKILLAKRRELKRDLKMHGNIEYVELCKTIRKRMRDEVRQYNTRVIEKVIAQGKGLKAANAKIRAGRPLMSSIMAADGSLITERRKITERCAEFYSELYNSTEVRPTSSDAKQEPVPEVLLEEVEHAMKQMSNNKAPGQDGIPIDVIKQGGPKIFKRIAQLFTRCLNERKTPLDWNNAVIILLHKKGDKKDINNYRPISLISHMSKLFTKVIKNRISLQLEEHQPREQAGFRRGYSTSDHLQVITQLIEKSNEYRLPLCLAFVDYEKAFDSVEHGGIISALREHGVHQAYVETLASMYSSCTSQVKLDKDVSDKFAVRRGVRQGDTLSPSMFTAGLEQVFRTLEWDEMGVNINGENLNHLRFADDIVLISHTTNELQDMLNQLHDKSRLLGLKMNMKKTKVMFNSHVPESTIAINGHKVEEVQDYIYLGQLITMNNTRVGEIERRIAAGWRAFAKYKEIMKGNTPICLKRKVYQQCIQPAMTYGCQTWATIKRVQERMRTAQRSMKRFMIGVTKRDHKTNM